jgi:cytoskeleton protein RodZ
LALDFDADCWVEVRDENNQVLLSGVSRAGDHRDLEAHGPLRIVVGNAPATRLSWNGRPVDLAEFTRVAVARLTLDPALDHP